MRKSVGLPEDEENRIDGVEPNEEEEEEEDDLSPTQKRIRTRMESAMYDAEGEEGTEESEGLSDVDVDAEGLDGDFAFGDEDSIAYEDEELGERSADDEEMKDPEEEEDDDDDDDDDEEEEEAEYRTGIGAPSGIPPVKKKKEGENRLPSEYGVTSSGLDYLPDEFFTQAATAITARVQTQKPTDSKTKEGKRKKRNRHTGKSKDLIIG